MIDGSRAPAAGSALERVRAAYARIAEADRPEVWIALRRSEEALADAAAIDARVARGEALALAGTTFAVKDNIDAAGLPTTAACPDYAYRPTLDSPSVASLRAAGAILLGKTNLDQFATGLTGTRSPYGAVRDARRPSFVSGGSSSGSAVAVALGVADVALATDTAGSGRVPAAFQGIVGVKPSRGLVSVRGVVPACRTLDCVSVFARTLVEAERAVGLITAPDPGDPLSRRWPVDAPLAAPPHPRIAVPEEHALAALTPAARSAFAAAAERLALSGAELVSVDIAPFLEVGRLLYGGAFVAERVAAVGAFAAAHPASLDPTVAMILSEARSITAAQLVLDSKRLDELRLEFSLAIAGTVALLLPTAPAQPSIEEVAADPRGTNSALGIYTTATNLLDLCAVSVPAGSADGGCFGVSLLAPAFSDLLCADLAARLLDEPRTPSVRSADAGPRALALLVVGAHLSGEPLNCQLTEVGAALEGAVWTTPEYRLYRLDTEPAKPGLVRVGDGGGSRIAGELWQLSPAALGDFLATLPSPMALTRVALDDGREVVGFTCEAAAIVTAEDITDHGGWRAYLAAVR